MPDVEEIINKNINNFKLKFSFITEKNTLFIQATITTTTFSNSTQMYIGGIATNPLIEFDTIKQILEQNEYKILNKTQDMIKLVIGPLTVKLVSITNQSTLQQEQAKQYNQLRQKIGESFQGYKKQQKQQQQKDNYCNEKEPIINNKNQVSKTLNDNMKLQKQEEDLLRSKSNFSRSSIINNMLRELQKRRHGRQSFSLFELKLKPQPISNDNNNAINGLKTIGCGNGDNQHGLGDQQQQQQEQQQLQLSQNNNRYKFDQYAKSQRITIYKNKYKAKKQYGSQYSSFILIDKKFHFHTDKQPKYWAIKYTKKVQWIGIGICLKYTSRIGEKYYNGRYYNWEQLGHGFYLIGSDKYCYSHSQKTINFVQKGFDIELGDVVFVEYNPEKMVIIFRLDNANSTKMLSMAISQPEMCGDFYVPFVALYGRDQTVQILQGERLSCEIYQ